MNLDTPRILVLNAGYEALGLTSVRRGVVLVMAEAAEVVVESGDYLRTPSSLYPVPSIVRLKRMIRRPQGRLALSRRNIFRRDHGTCQYCGHTGGPLTLDHVIPRSKEGKTIWENLVTSCPSCNSRKRNHTPEEAGMHLIRAPRRPRFAEYVLLAVGNIPSPWYDFLPGAS